MCKKLYSTTTGNRDQLNPEGNEIKETVADVGQLKRRRETEHTSQKPQKVLKRGERAGEKVWQEGRRGGEGKALKKPCKKAEKWQKM